MTSTYHCEKCSKLVLPEQAIRSMDAKVLGCITGLAVGATTRNVWGMLLFAAAGAMVGDIVDREVAPKCPECAAVLKCVARAYLATQGVG